MVADVREMTETLPVTPPDTPPLLEVRGLRKVYGGTAALSDVDMQVGPGEIHALLGENGAGKSTLVKILAAVEHEDGGEIRYAGTTLPSRRTPRSMAERGVVFIHQDLGLVGTMSVAENIAQYAGYPVGPSGIRWEETRTLARDALSRLEVSLDPDTLVAELSIAEQATVAIARALVQDARLIVLDEPTASLAAGEARRLLTILKRLRESGLACILVTHRIDEVLTHCDRVTVLRNGALVGSCPVAELTQHKLIEMIVGSVPQIPARREVPPAATVRLSVSGLAGPGFGPVSFDVSPGEIVAVTGFADGGHLALVSSLFGARPVEEGLLLLDGEAYRPVQPADALRRRVQHVPADRNAEGLAGNLTARENMFPNPHAGLRPVNRRAEREQAAAWMDAFDIRPRNCEATVSVFSGGNAQKVLVARALASRPRLLLLSEPTTGVDVGARATIYAKLHEACAEGLSIVVASSDFQEVADLADRAVVLCRGTVTRVLDVGDITVPALTAASYGT